MQHNNNKSNIILHGQTLIDMFRCFHNTEVSRLYQSFEMKRSTSVCEYLMELNAVLKAGEIIVHEFWNNSQCARIIESTNKFWMDHG